MTAKEKRSSEISDVTEISSRPRGPSENIFLLGIVNLSSCQNAGASYCHE